MLSEFAPFPEAAFEYRYRRASGPGGQHVNKTSTAVELRVDLGRLGLEQDALRRLLHQQRGRINQRSELIIQADRFRSQRRNRADAIERFHQLIDEARKRPRRRLRTQPGPAARRRRLEAKKRRGDIKSQRRKPRFE